MYKVGGISLFFSTCLYLIIFYYHKSNQKNLNKPEDFSKNSTIIELE